MSQITESTDYDALGKVIDALKALGPEDRKRVLQTVATFFQIPETRTGAQYSARSVPVSSAPTPSFDEAAISPKDFIFEKKPRTDVERIACLAYYLTHNQGIPHFKTLDLSKLNTEAAQPKFTNPAYASNNAQKLGYLVAATKGRRQLSAAAEQFVRALPDREAAKAAMSDGRPKTTSYKKVKESKSS